MKQFVQRPIATSMFFMGILVLGIYSYFNIPFELAPKEDFPRMSLNTNWPQAPPEAVQIQITSPLEEMASTVRGVRKITSNSSIGSSEITLDFEKKTNMKFATLDLREKIDRVRKKLPSGALPTQLIPYVPEDFKVESFIHYTISGDYPLQTLREMIKEKMEFGISSVKGVAAVEVSGGSEPEMRINIDKEKVKAFGIHPYKIRQEVLKRLQTYQTGTVKKSNREYVFKVSNSIKSLKELENTIVAYSGKNPVFLKDLATVVPTYGDIYHKNRINGKPSIRLRIHKEKGLSTIKVAKRVKGKIKSVKKDLPEDLIFKTVNDESEIINKNLQSFYLLVGIILFIIFIFVFVIIRSLKPSFLILSSIVCSVLITFNLIYLFKISLNMLTLGGLALGFGLFVDNSIVVFENVLRFRERGRSAFQAAVEGSKEVFLPVLASTLTTMSVFFSFAYFQGRLKIYYLPLAIVISSALASSLLVSFSLIPALSPKLLSARKKKGNQVVRNGYERLLRKFIHHPVEIILMLLIIFYGSYKLFKSKVTIGDFFSWSYRQKLYVSVRMPPGTELKMTDDLIKKFENIVLAKKYKKEINTTVQPEMAYMIISFPPDIENSYYPYLLKEELIQLATEYAGIGASISGFDPKGYHVSMDTRISLGSSIKFFGCNLKKLKEITAELEENLKRNPRIREVKISSGRGGWDLDSFEYLLKINKDVLNRYDIAPQYLYFQIESLIRGSYSGGREKIKMGGKEIEIAFKFPEADHMDLKRLANTIIKSKRHEYLRIGDITKIEKKPIAGSIYRENQKFQQIVSWKFRGPYKTAENYKEAVFSRLQLPPGFSATVDYGYQITEEEKGQIKFAIIISLVIIFMILASLYESLIQPFFILLAVPLALIGVFIAYVLADFIFDSAAYIGVILLGGIVVNNSILVVDHINGKRKEGVSLLESVVKGSRERIRPIFLTTSTTVLGMLPMILIQLEVGNKQIWSSLALSAVGGLISSTLFILIAIPLFYFYGDSLNNWWQRKLKEFKGFKNKLL